MNRVLFLFRVYTNSNSMAYFEVGVPTGASSSWFIYNTIYGRGIPSVISVFGLNVFSLRKGLVCFGKVIFRKKV
jgi:hypothetical protein